MSMKTYGIGAFRKSVERAIELTERFESQLQQAPDWEVITKANLAVITFRFNPADSNLTDEEIDRINQHLSDQIIADGKAMLATTVVNDRTVLRMCLINPRTTMDDLQATIESLEEYASKLTQ
jgi:aromatic-L-amino-acid decarboxylase